MWVKWSTSPGDADRSGIPRTRPRFDGQAFDVVAPPHLYESLLERCEGSEQSALDLTMEAPCAEGAVAEPACDPVGNCVVCSEDPPLRVQTLDNFADLFSGDGEHGLGAQGLERDTQIQAAKDFRGKDLLRGLEVRPGSAGQK